MTVALILARMTSSRFPGKVLASFRGEPVLAHVVRRTREVFDDDQVFVATSDDVTDNPLAEYAMRLGVRVFRGPLDDVFERFRRCAALASATWAIRINADSPLISPKILQAVAARAVDPYDLVTTIAPRTLPKGQNPEAIRSSVLWSTDVAQLRDADREHVTAYFHRHPDRFRIRHIGCKRAGLAAYNLSVDTPDDLARLESLSQSDIDWLIPDSLDG